MTPQRLAVLIAAMFVLASTVAVASARYPDEEVGITIDRARAIDDAGRPRGSSFATCPNDAPHPDRPCVAAHLHNFAARARVIGGGVVAALILTAVAFRRRYDRGQARVALGHG